MQPLTTTCSLLSTVCQEQCQEPLSSGLAPSVFFAWLHQSSYSKSTPLAAYFTLMDFFHIESFFLIILYP